MVILKGNVNALIYLQSFRSKIVFNPIRRLDSWKILLLIQVAHLTGRPSSRCLLGGLCCPGDVWHVCKVQSSLAPRVTSPIQALGQCFNRDSCLLCGYFCYLLERYAYGIDSMKIVVREDFMWSVLFCMVIFPRLVIVVVMAIISAFFIWGNPSWIHLIP